MPFSHLTQFAGQLTINLSAIRHNYALCQKQVGDHCEVAAAVKADAYGTGLQEAASALMEAGCKTFFVATLEEGVRLRQTLGQGEIRICVLNGLHKGAEDILDFHSLTPVINSLEELENWASYAKRTRPYLKCILHIDTGMARLGLSRNELDFVAARTGDYAKILDIDYVMSHFACADEKNHPLNEQQAQRFSEAAEFFTFSRRSLANSSGIFRDKSWHHDMVRPGFCLYGGNPTPETANPMRPVVGLSVPVLQRRRLPKGESAGYAASWIADHDTDLATVQLGYADGFIRSASNSAKLYWQGYACPVIGRVSMDLTIISLEGVPADLRPNPGDLIEVLGPHQSVDDLATDIGSIGYEVLTSLGKRYVRTYTRAA